MNYGYERRIGPYLINGFDTENQTLYEFYYFHGHDCERTQNVTNQKWLASREKRYKDTINKLDFLKSQKYQLKHGLSFNRKYPKTVSQAQIIDAIVDETLFGCEEIDIEVPLSWDEVQYEPETNLPPYRCFEEMSLIFCTTKVPFDCIGEHMQNHAKEHGLSQKPRKLLVGKPNTFLATPLVKWYIEHGLKVTVVHRVVEFAKLACFTDFGKQVTTARRQGDVDLSLEILATINKLIGNSAFGGTIINLEQYLNIRYCKGRKQACMTVNNPRFRQLCNLSDDVYETEFSKSNITVNLPIQLGYMILNYAKLSFLKFYYDCLLKYVDRRNF
ncbi:LOW QUALITY PROTEIN: hypothetical protein KUTeg_010501 [Tegillarca granosa]|uniref:Uncharacterized protein n=1 Tax=Tegillarca granosa TaxID=220873 RepID=A0ABQ9F3H8_TEGGR|nr:LOW QUALITY PROTEIN: hypothetical protein KUTeg_010501 [Tegillarca granosa]